MYCSSEYGNLKTPAMAPKDFGLSQAGVYVITTKTKGKMEETYDYVPDWAIIRD